MSYYDSESDWSWLFHNGLDWASLIPLFYPKFPTEDGLESKEEVIHFHEELLKTISKWSSTSINEKAAGLDKIGAVQALFWKILVRKKMAQSLFLPT